MIVRHRVFDPVQRFLHWWIAATVMALAALGWAEKLTEAGAFKQALAGLHIALGFALAVGLLLRVLWGFIGPEHARFSSFWQAISRNRRRWQTVEEDFGHQGPASLAYLFLYLTVFSAVLSGLLLAAMRYDRGPFAEALFDELAWHELTLSFHDCTVYGVTLFVVLHVVGMIHHEKKVGAPVAQAMISGYQYRKRTQDRDEP